MSTLFTFATAGKILFGSGVLRNELGTLITEHGTKVFLVAGSNIARASPVTDILDACCIEYTTFCVTSEVSYGHLQFQFYVTILKANNGNC